MRPLALALLLALGSTPWVHTRRVRWFEKCRSEPVDQEFDVRIYNNQIFQCCRQDEPDAGPPTFAIIRECVPCTPVERNRCVLDAECQNPDGGWTTCTD